MQISQLIAIGGLLATRALAHSWLECVDTQVEKKDYYKEHPEQFSDSKESCKGYPRNIRERAYDGSVQPKSWVDESSLYSYEFNDYEDGKPQTEEYALACRKCQQTPTSNGPPAATVTPGQEVLMRYWGNGHSYWDPTYSNPQKRDPGVIRIYWSGKKETDLKYKKDLTMANWIPGAQANFSADAIIQRDPSKVVHNQKGQEQRWMKEWANYFTFKVPEDIETGRHMMVWGWAWAIAPTHDTNKPLEKCEAQKFNEDFELQFGTCFDIIVKNGASSPSKSQAAHQAKYKDYKPDTSDACDAPCAIGGNKDMMCDPKKQTCGACRVLSADGSRQCYDCSPTVMSWGSVVDCSKKKRSAEPAAEIPQLRPRHSHRHKHRRSKF